jgi:hypothetical protein
MAVLPNSPPPSRTMYAHAEVLEAFLSSPDKATSPDVNDVVQADNGSLINLGWLRQLARDVRKVATHLSDMEPKEAQARSVGASAVDRDYP